MLEKLIALLQAMRAKLRRLRLSEAWPGGRAFATIAQHRPVAWDADGNPTEWIEVGEAEVVHNLITNVGRIQLHTAGYGTSGLPSNGFNYIALSNDTVGETAASTTLSNEIAANGLSRAQGTVTLPTGSGNQTTIAKTFTATGTQAAQKAALFDASSSGDMNHVLGFTQRSLLSGDTLTITFTITLG